MTEPQTSDMPDTKFTFSVGMALGEALATPPTTTIPRLEPGQRSVQMWSEPDWLGYRTLLTFELREVEETK